MTLIAGLLVGEGQLIETLYLAGDSRVTLTQNGKLEFYTDRAQKVIQVSPNVLIGYAGDYYQVNEVINTMKFQSDFFCTNDDEQITKISQFFKGKWSPAFADTSLLVCVASHSEVFHWKLYQLDAPSFLPRRKRNGIHLIGMDEKVQKCFKESFETAKKGVVPNDFDAFYVLSLTSAFREVFSYEVNGIISCAMLRRGAPQVRWAGYAVNRDGENWLSQSPTGDGYIQSVNGRQFGATTTDHKQVKDGLRKNIKDEY